jgi:regulator of protease activity HflC (stomatin/prohibitin superfamily)
MDMQQIDFPSPEQLAKSWSRAAVVVVAVAILALFFSSYSVISPGNTGVIFNVWTGSLRTVPQGIAWRVPFITRVQSYPTALRTYTMVRRSGEGSAQGDDSIDLPTREGQHIRQDISVTFNTSEGQAAQVFKAFRGADIADIESTFIRRTIITVAQNTAGQMDLSEVISSKRNQLQDGVQMNLTAELEKMGFHLDKVNLGASHLPQSLELQMQQKMAAQQQAQQAEYELQKNQMLAKAEVAKAEGEAQATLVRAKAQAEANQLLQATLTQNLIQSKAIDKWNGTLPQVSGGATPFIDLRSVVASK